MVGLDGAMPLPWLAEPLRQALQTQCGHAVLLHGPRGVGQFDLALTLAQAWLCEAAQPGIARPCGVCTSCRLAQSHAHPDLLVLLPQVLVESLGWSAGAEEDAGTERSSKAKPSKEIKVDAVRAAVAFAQTTSARGLGKVVVIHPAEQMNSIAANTLLKTLEEPPGETRFVLSCALPEALPPTVRSRCQALRLALPPTALASAWLKERGVAQPEVLLAAAGGQPLEALEWVQLGVDAALWLRLPGLVAQGQAAAFASLPVAWLVDALQKLCHDALCQAAGSLPRYFPASALTAAAAPAALSAWSQALRRSARHAEHPWNAALMVEALMLQGQSALASRPGKQGISVH